jgi:hypothetical protein
MVVPSGNPDDALPPVSTTDLILVVGCINYVATAFCPDVAVEVSLLGREFQRPTIRSAKKANATLAWI